MLLTLKLNYSTCKCLVYAIKVSIYCHDIVKCNYRISVVDFLSLLYNKALNVYSLGK